MIRDGAFPFPNTSGDWPRVGDGLIVLDDSARVTWASPNALSSLSRLDANQNIIGRPVVELGFTDIPERALRSRRLMDGEVRSNDTDIQIRVLPFLSGERASGAAVLCRDVSELRRKERMISVKDATIREVHHRVKNNLQTIASLLRLQSRRLQSKEAVAALEESVMRIGSIALVHETLSAAPSDVAEFGDIARRIARMVSDGLVDPERSIDIKVSGSTGPLGAELATPLAVTVTELIQNAMEHAFPDGRSGIVVIELLRTDSAVQVVVRDDGVGMDPSARLKQGSRLGLQIVSSLVQEMEGEMHITTDGGTHIELRLPL
jgi:two-component sensor histidine kinase